MRGCPGTQPADNHICGVCGVMVHNLCILNILKVEGAGPGGFRCGKRSCKMKKRPEDADV